jgi:acyl carrier protein phosphodiesterase
VVYDHFLAVDENEFSEALLYDFSQQAYQVIEQYSYWLPEKFARLFPYMKSQNWFFNYRTPGGTQQSFGGIVRRAAYLSESQKASELFEQHYQLLQDCYRHFWKDVKPFARTQYEWLLNTHP